MTLLIGCLALLVVAVVLLGLFRDLLYSALGLAAASIMLSIVLFQFGANIAAVFELSVCAGLITVLFVSTVCLTKDSDQKGESRLPARFLIPMLVVFVGVAFAARLARSHVAAAPAAAPGTLPRGLLGAAQHRRAGPDRHHPGRRAGHAGHLAGQAPGRSP